MSPASDPSESPTRPGPRGRVRFAVAAALIIVFATAAGLASGADWLMIDLFGTGLPLGTLATAVSMTLLPALALPWAVDGRIRGAAWVLIAAGALWWPVSALVAGNLRLAFTDGPEAWWTVTQALPLLSVLLLAVVAVQAARRRWRGGDRRQG